MSKSELEEQDNQSTPRSEVAVIGCGEPNGKHSKVTQLVAANSFYNGLIPHIYYFSPNTSRLLTNKKFLSSSGFPITVCGSTPQASFEIIQKLGNYETRTWIGIAPEVPRTYDVTREGVLYLWRQTPSRDIVFNNMPMEDALSNWAFDYLKYVRLVVCQTDSEKILYSDQVKVISEKQSTSSITILSL
jgi:hypothetical protein